MKKYNEILLLIALAIIGCFMGCNGPKRTQRQLIRAHASHPTLTAKDCADWYPVQTHDSVRVEFRPGSTVLRHDTVRIDCDQVKPDSSGRRIVDAPCPPCPTKTDTLIITNTQVRENTARVRQLEGERDKAKTTATERTSGRNNWRWIAIALLAYTALRIALRLWIGISLP